VSPPPLSVDSFTQYETEDTSPHPEASGIQSESEHIEVVRAHLELETDEVTVQSDSTEEDHTLISSQSHLPLTANELRQRSTIINREPSTIFGSETNGRDIHASASASGSMIGNESQKEMNNDQNDCQTPQQTVSAEDRVPDIKFTIKFLNDTQLEVTTQPGENIADFKR